VSPESPRDFSRQRKEGKRSLDRIIPLVKEASLEARGCWINTCCLDLGEGDRIRTRAPHVKNNQAFIP